MSGGAVLVTGANGFIGRRLCSELAALDGPVIGAVRALDAQMAGNGVRHVEVGSIDAGTDWSAALTGVDRVVHLAGRAHVMGRGEADPAEAYARINRDATRRLAEAAAAAGVRRFVFVSSAKVHGDDSAERAFTEDDAPHPEDPYARSKHEAELALEALANRNGMEIVVVRPPLVYGAGVKANFLNLMRWIDRGVPLPLASIHNRRSLLYVGNLVSAIASCLEHEAAAGRTYLVSDGEDLSTPGLIRLLARSMGRRAALLPLPVGVLRGLGRLAGRPGAVERLAGSMAVDSSRIRRELQWSPPFAPGQGMQSTASWYRANGCPR